MKTYYATNLTSSLVLIFDATPILVGIFVIFLALSDRLASALPTIRVIFWILFALYVLLLIFTTITNEMAVSKKLGCFIIAAISALMIGIVSNDFFNILEKSYSSGGINGIINFILTAIFIGMEWLLSISSLSYGAMKLIDAEEECESYTKCLWIGIGIIAVNFFLFFR